jgi:signal transduction histidine kinase
MRALTSNGRPWRVTLTQIDALVALALSVDLVLESMLTPATPDRIVTAVFGVLVAAPIAVRRRWPAQVVLWSSAVQLLEDPFHGQLYNLSSASVVIALILCTYAAGAWLPSRRSILAFGTAIVVLAVSQWISTYVTGVTGGDLGDIGTLLLIVTVPWVLGRFIYERNRRAAAFATLAAQVEAERAERERAAVTQERLTIGRELQDIIAHNVSVMVVQAGGARRLLRDEPERARESILTVEETGRKALAEMRRLLGLLRKDDDPRALTPQPGLDQLTELAELMRGHGLECEIRTDGQPIELTPGVDLVSYRVIETALERAVASHGRHATATVRYQPRELQLDVRGDCALASAGRELSSISERVALYGGKLAVLAPAPSEFAVRCRLPLEGALS